MRILVTGAAGFIGSALSLRLLARGDEVLGYDNLNDYYDVEPEAGPAGPPDSPNDAVSRSVHDAIEDRPALEKAFADFRRSGWSTWRRRPACATRSRTRTPTCEANLVGFMNILEACRHGGVEHLVYASSSSVYGANRKLPFATSDPVDHPVSLYAASKKANELMAHTYSHLYQLPTTGLRFFTVYGPWGRPDMALFLFTRKILAGEPIDVFNHGRHTRDFTYIDDIVEGVIRVLDQPAAPDPDFDPLQPDPGNLRSALPGLQHRQQPARRADPLHRGAGGVPGTQGGEEPAAAAAGRRPRHLCRRRLTGARHGLQAGHDRGDRHSAFRGLVPGLLQSVSI